MCVCVRERERVCVRVCVSVCVCVRERERVCFCARVGDGGDGLCVCARETEWGRGEGGLPNIELTASRFLIATLSAL